MFVCASTAKDFLLSLEDNSVSLLLTDPPYMGIVSNSWDNQWKSTKDYVDWMLELFAIGKQKLKDNGSLVFFGGIGKHGERPFFELMMAIEERDLFKFRNLTTWKKKRAYGKSHDYLFCREEIAWYSKSFKPKEVVFNVPYLAEKRGYEGFSKKYKAKSEYKRVSNVWSDITELFRPERVAQKPLPLIERLIATHSNPGDLVVDPFVGWGTTGVAAIKLDRRFLGSEAIEADAVKANERCLNVSNK